MKKRRTFDQSRQRSFLTSASANATRSDDHSNRLTSTQTTSASAVHVLSKRRDMNSGTVTKASSGKIRSEDDHDNGRVKLLSETTVAFVRAGQVIGSPYRAMEELVRNAIIHGRSTEVNVTIGSSSSIEKYMQNQITGRPSAIMNMIEVKDNGIGISEESTRDFIGTLHCSSQVLPVPSSSSQLSQTSSCRGESLKALSSLCAQFRITTICSELESQKEGKSCCDNSCNNIDFRLTSAPSKPRKRFRYSSRSIETPKLHRSNGGNNVRDSLVDDRNSRQTKIFTSSEKIIRDGITVSFQSNKVTCKDLSLDTGTTVQLYGLFHRHEVRLKHNSQFASSSSSNKDALPSTLTDQLSMGQVRSCLQLLAMAFPSVTIRLFCNSHPNATNVSIPTMLRRPTIEWQKPKLPSLESDAEGRSKISDNQSHIAQALKLRLIQLCGNSSQNSAGWEISTKTYMDVYYVEENQGSNSCHRENQSSFIHRGRYTKSSAGGRGGDTTGRYKYSRNVKKYLLSDDPNMWTVRGCILQTEFNPLEETEPSKKVVNNQIHHGRIRQRQHELIFVNGRLFKHHSSLADLIQKQFERLHRGGQSEWCFLLHISCPTKDVDLVVDDVRSYSALRQRERLTALIQNALAATLPAVRQGDGEIDCVTSSLKNWVPKSASTRLTDSTRSFCVTKDMPLSIPGSHMHNRTDKSLSLLYRSTRVISGQATKLSTTKAVHMSTPSTTTGTTLSPFSEAFLDLDAKGKRDISNISKFASALKKQDVPSAIDKTSTSSQRFPRDKVAAKDSALDWTRSRLNALNNEIQKLSSHKNTQSKPINISKGMLASARFVAHLEQKFILVHMDGILCAVDQHAADERIGLERLENALQSSILSSNECITDDMTKLESFDLSKMKNIRINNLLKCLPSTNKAPIALSPTQMSVLGKSRDLLNKWKFNFDIDEGSNQVTLTHVPSICNKVATSKDFLQMIQALGCRTSDISLVKPAFVKRVIASFACRYAIMFGDSLTENKCKEIISSLATCDLCFICAHGRPSVAPLVDMTIMIKEDCRLTSEGNKAKEGNIPLRFRPCKRFAPSQQQIQLQNWI